MLQGRRPLAGIGKAAARISIERLRDDTGNLQRHAGGQRRHWPFDDCCEELVIVAADERVPAREHFVENDAKRPDVAARIGRSPRTCSGAM